MKCTVVYGCVHTGDYLFMMIKNRSMFHFKGNTIITWLLVQMKHTEINGCLRTCNCHLLFSSWNQHCPRSQNLLLVWRSMRCMFVKYWLRILKDVLLCMTVCWKNNTAIQVWKILWGKVCKALVCLSGDNWMVQKMKRQAVLFLISLI